jgi:hypothetical protein
MSGRGAAGRAERAARLRRCLDDLTAEDAARTELDAVERQTAADYLAQARTAHPRRGAPPRGVDPVALAEAALERSTNRHGPEHRFTRRAHQHLTTVRATSEQQTTSEQQATTEQQATARTPAGKPCKHGTRCRRRGCRPSPAQRNSTDPDSRLMPTRRGFVQGYNAQLAGSADHFIVAADLVQDTGDVTQLTPMMSKTSHTADLLRRHRPDPHHSDADIGTVLADNGYCSHANLTTPGPDRLIATGKTRDLHHTATTNPATGAPPDTATPFEAMQHRLRTPEGATLYKKRGATIEPINGHLKDRGNLRTFLLRGIQACKAELHLAALTHNLRRLHTLTTT